MKNELEDFDVKPKVVNNWKAILYGFTMCILLLILTGIHVYMNNPLTSAVCGISTGVCIMCLFIEIKENN